MVEFLGFQISFTTVAIWAALWMICLCLWVMSLKNKELNNDVTERLELDDAKKYMMEKKEFKSKYGKFYKKNVKGLFQEGSFFSKIGINLVPNPGIMEKKLEVVGSDLTVEEYVSIKVLSLIGGTLLVAFGVLFNMNTIILGVGAMVLLISFGLEEQLVGAKFKQRKVEIERGLPNFLDLLYSACKTGHTVTEGIKKVSTKYTGVISDEFNLAMINFKSNGGDFKSAMEEMMDRNNSEPLTNVLSDILISYEKGDDQIIETIRQEALSMREIVNAEIEEQANKKATSLLFPMLIFFFMPLLAFILIPLLSQFTALMGA